MTKSNQNGFAFRFALPIAFFLLGMVAEAKFNILSKYFHPIEQLCPTPRPTYVQEVGKGLTIFPNGKDFSPQVSEVQYNILADGKVIEGTIPADGSIFVGNNLKKVETDLNYYSSQNNSGPNAVSVKAGEHKSDFIIIDDLVVINREEESNEPCKDCKNSGDEVDNGTLGKIGTPSNGDSYTFHTSSGVFKLTRVSATEFEIDACGDSVFSFTQKGSAMVVLKNGVALFEVHATIDSTGNVTIELIDSASGQNQTIDRICKG